MPTLSYRVCTAGRTSCCVSQMPPRAKKKSKKSKAPSTESADLTDFWRPDPRGWRQRGLPTQLADGTALDPGSRNDLLDILLLRADIGDDIGVPLEYEFGAHQLELPEWKQPTTSEYSKQPLIRTNVPAASFAESFRDAGWQSDQRMIITPILDDTEIDACKKNRTQFLQEFTESMKSADFRAKVASRVQVSLSYTCVCRVAQVLDLRRRDALEAMRRIQHSSPRASAGPGYLLSGCLQTGVSH